MKNWLSLAWLPLTLLLACGGESPEPPPTTTGEILPLQVGNTWTYRVTDSAGVVSLKTNTVEARERVGGSGPQRDVLAFKIVTKKSNGADETHSWQDNLDGKIVRYREIAFGMTSGLPNGEEHWDPYKLRVDGTPANTRLQTSFTQEYWETKVDTGVTTKEVENWFVAKVDERVTVGEDAFNAIVLERTGAQSTKRYWFVPGVGKVRESGGQSEELESYTLAP